MQIHITETIPSRAMNPKFPRRRQTYNKIQEKGKGQSKHNAQNKSKRRGCIREVHQRTNVRLEKPRAFKHEPTKVEGTDLKSDGGDKQAAFTFFRVRQEKRTKNHLSHTCRHALECGKIESSSRIQIKRKVHTQQNLTVLKKSSCVAMDVPSNEERQMRW